MQIDPHLPDPKEGNQIDWENSGKPDDPAWLKDYNEYQDGNPYKYSGPYGSCHVKCCRWQLSRLEREYDSEIRGRERILLGWFYKSRLQACIIGWAIAKGQDPADAKQFATHVQYH